MSGASSTGSTGGITRARFGSAWGNSDPQGREDDLIGDLLFVLIVVLAAVFIVVFVRCILRDPGLVRLALHLVELLTGGIKRFLLGVDVAPVLRVVLIPLKAARADARIDIQCRRAHTKFALVEVDLVVQGIDLCFLLGDFVVPLVRRLLACGSG